jgi:DNA-binding GntR family transcriptional regulator
MVECRQGKPLTPGSLKLMETYMIRSENSTAHPAGSSVQDLVYTALRKSIINLNLIPGAVVSEKEISLCYHVSRTPVREALIHLSKEGLVQVIPQRGTMVSLIDPSRVQQEFFLRECLETAVLPPFIRNCDGSHIEELERLIGLQEQALSGKSYGEFIEYDDNFHRFIFETAGQPLSWDLISGMCGHYHRVRVLTIWMAETIRPGAPPGSPASELPIGTEKIRQHRIICAAFKSKDPERARDALYSHLHDLEPDENLLQREFPRYFVPRAAKNSFDVDFGGFPAAAGQDGGQRAEYFHMAYGPGRKANNESGHS